MNAKVLWTIVLIFMSLRSISQELEKYRWNNRIIVLTSIDHNSDQLNNQIKELQSDVQGLDERKILVFRVTPTSWIEGLNDAKEQDGNSLYNKLNPEQDFRYYLIGLDGGIKMRKNEIVSNETLFRTIDSMPMRRSELDNEGY